MECACEESHRWNRESGRCRSLHQLQWNFEVSSCTGKQNHRLTIHSAWSWPNITGLKDFQGTLCHTANYDPKTDLDGKRVAVIGIGSSGVQIIPNIVNQVSKLYAWVRSPTWMTAGFAQKFAGPNGQNFRCKITLHKLRTLFTNNAARY